MHACLRRCVIARVPAAPYWHIAFSKTTRKVASKARRSAPSAQLVKSMEKSLTPQAFASNNLNRSLADRRDAEFIRIAFPHAHYVIVSGSKIMVSRNPAVQLRWVEASELQKLSYSPAADGTIQHSQRGMLAISCHAWQGKAKAQLCLMNAGQLCQCIYLSSSAPAVLQSPSHHSFLEKRKAHGGW